MNLSGKGSDANSPMRRCDCVLRRQVLRVITQFDGTDALASFECEEALVEHGARRKLMVHLDGSIAAQHARGDRRRHAVSTEVICG